MFKEIELPFVVITMVVLCLLASLIDTAIR